MRRERLVTALAAAACTTAWLFCWALAARYWYRRIRPWTEPLSCTSPACQFNGYHQPRCYIRWQNVGDNGTALGFAVMLAMPGPLMLAAVGLGRVIRWVVMSGDRELAAEVAAKNERLERELGIGGER